MKQLQLLKSARGWYVYPFLALILSGFIFLAVQSYHSIDRELTDSSLSRRYSIAQLAATTLSEKFKRLTGIGVALATRVRFRALIAECKWLEAADILSSTPQDFPYIERIFLTDVYGTEMADIPQLPGAVGKNFAYRDWYKGVSSNWEPYISPVYKRAAIPQRNVFAVAVPIKSDDGRVLGILVMQSDLEGFFTWAQGLDIGPGGFVYVIDNKGNVAYHPEYPAQGEIKNYSGVPVVKKVLQGLTGIEVTYNPIEKEERVSAYVPVNYGWGVIAQQPTLTAFADKNRQLTIIVTGYGLILLFCILVMGLAIRIFYQRRRAEEDHRVMAALEKRVAERTAQLEATNKELESFSYSVSHDLRSPLRAIEGFSRILEEDYGEQLDDEGKRLLKVVQENSMKMSLLIDDLLSFSRLGRQSIKPAEIDFNNLVKDVAEEVKNGSANKQVEFTMHPLPAARADHALLKQVWLNLISNAVKYSSTREHPVVELGGEVNGKEIVYYIRDNGAGFDMEYYDKLFTVFQRLHRPEEFPGTGIGLAIVQRVVNRHGGRIWAEGKVNEGATFYFTLPKEGEQYGQ